MNFHRMVVGDCAAAAGNIGMGGGFRIFFGVSVPVASEQNCRLISYLSFDMISHALPLKNLVFYISGFDISCNFPWICWLGWLRAASPAPGQPSQLSSQPDSQPS